MKAVKVKLQEINPDRVKVFEKNAQAHAKKIIANFDDYEFVRSHNSALWRELICNIKL
jgi:Translationally controlled tumour protein